MGEIRYRLVRAEATEAMDIAGRSAPTMLTPTGTATAVKLVFAAMCSASPPPAAEDIDVLCRVMWPKKWQWLPGQDARADQGGHTASYLEAVRNDDRVLMRAFVAHLTGQETK